MILSLASSMHVIWGFNEVSCELRFLLELRQERPGKKSLFKVFVGMHLVYLEISFTHKHTGM